MNNVAQGAAVLAVLLMTKNEKIKSICSASGISALLGITEPAMFGVTLKLKYPFYAAMTGSAVGSAYLAGTRTLAQALGAAGLPGFISMKPDHYLNFAIGLALSMAVSFGLTIVFWKKFGLERQDGTGKQAVRETGKKRGTEDTADAVEAEGAAVGTVEAEGAAVAAGTVEQEGAVIADRAVEPESPAGPERTPAQFYSPMNGRILPVSQSADEMFASRALGDGNAVDPADGLVCAPCDGTVTMIFPTGHAMGIASDSGFEVLIHAGIDTVKLNGEGFEVFVEQGKHVKKGDFRRKPWAGHRRSAGRCAFRCGDGSGFYPQSGIKPSDHDDFHGGSGARGGGIPRGERRSGPQGSRSQTKIAVGGIGCEEISEGIPGNV